MNNIARMWALFAALMIFAGIAVNGNTFMKADFGGLPVYPGLYEHSDQAVMQRALDYWNILTKNTESTTIHFCEMDNRYLPLAGTGQVNGQWAIIFNKHHNFSVDRPAQLASPNGISMQAIAHHEIGHVVGVGTGDWYRGIRDTNGREVRDYWKDPQEVKRITEDARKGIRYVFIGKASADVYGDVWMGGHKDPRFVPVEMGYQMKHFQRGSSMDHPYIRFGVMNAMYTSSARPFFSEAELALFRDRGHVVDIEGQFGRSVYTDGNSAANDRTFKSNNMYGIGLHIVGDRNTIIQTGDIQANGWAGAGMRIEGVDNKVIVHPGTTIAANGENGYGILVTHGTGAHMVNRGKIEALGKNGIGVHLNSGTFSDGYWQVKDGHARQFDNSGVINAGNNHAIYAAGNRNDLDINFMHASDVTGDIVVDKGSKMVLTFGKSSDPSGAALDTGDHSAVMWMRGNIYGDGDTEVQLWGGRTNMSGIVKARNFTNGYRGNAATLHPAGKLVIVGNYTQTSQGILSIDVTSPKANDKLLVMGKARLDGTLETTWRGGYIPAEGTRLGYFLVATSDITGNFSILRTNITPTLVLKPGLQSFTANKMMYLVAERDYLNPNLTDNLGKDQQSIIQVLAPSLIAAKGDFQRVQEAIDALGEYGQVASALDQLKPRGTEARLGLAVSGNTFQSDNITERLREVRQGIQGINLTGLDLKDGNGTRVMLASFAEDLTNMLPPRLNKWGFFAKGNVSYGDQKDSDGSRGYDYRASGITAGCDYRFTDNFISGLTLGYNYARADLDDAGSKVKLGSYTLGAYGTYYRNNFYIDGSIGYGLMDYNNTRRIVFPGIDRTASSSPGGRQHVAYAGTGYDIRKDAWTITPNISLQYARIDIDSYEESGAGALNLHVDGQSTESMQGTLGVRLVRLWQVDTYSLLPYIRASYGYEFFRDNQSITSFFLQQGSPFITDTLPVNRNLLNLGVGLTVMKNRDLSISFNYDAQIGDEKYVSHNLSAGLRLQF